ncbi:molybdate ABC transporter substrate-binding protein [Bacillus altitudinis]|uniref:molybdate ABC transporter substrate-binding protein n=1 Tax=Bacillus altitudinis TaxID=293387 RepID=UPI00064CC3E6|nr:molybdate ABC transporter substrate-binding protein [Bacillus altitudinis]KLV25009.1 molybdenum ABC transporter substrate-binding protein [Bacillus altitudinis]
MKYLFLTYVTICLLLTGCQTESTSSDQSKKTELVISAAASLQDALKEIESAYEDDHPNVTLTNNFGSSGALKQQIAQGAKADLFFSAAEEPFDDLVQSGDIDQDLAKDVIQNELVLIVPKEGSSSIKTFRDVEHIKGKIALGTPESVPAGTYAKEIFTKLNIWDQVKQNAVYGKDVRQVLNYVETGNVEAGVVYKTDALVSRKVKIVDEANQDMHSPIIYPVGIVKQTDHMKEAKAFFQYLQSDPAAAIFKKYGFQVK